MASKSPKQVFKARLNRVVPSPAVKTIRAVVDLTSAEKHECNMCGYSGRFWPFGNPPRRGAVCGKCNSLERHRLAGLWLESNASAVDGARILHFAPEPVVAKLLRSHSSRYRSADISQGAADTVLNIEDIDLPDESVDLIVCFHVLEHVNDAKALREMFRILVPDGLALLMFPVVEGWERTYEDPAHTSKTDRELYFGQSDHVRMFGSDVRNRIRSAGFALTEFTAEEPNVARYGLVRGEKLFIASKPGT